MPVYYGTQNINFPGISKIYVGNVLVWQKDFLKEYMIGSIEKITASDLTGLTKLGYYAFAYCSKLKSITIPNTFTGFESSFRNYLRLDPEDNTVTNDEELICQRGLKNIFWQCYNLEDVNFLPNSSSPIMKGIQLNSSNQHGVASYNAEANDFTTLIYIPPNVTTINLGYSSDGRKIQWVYYDTFYDYNNIISIDFSNTQVSECPAFNGCSSLTTLNLGPIITVGIVPNTFSGCASLTALDLSNVNTIYGIYPYGEMVSIFSALSSLQTLYLPFIGDTLTNNQTYLHQAFLQNTAPPPGYEDRYYAVIRDGMTYQIPISLTTVGVKAGEIVDYCFTNMTSITTVNLTPSITNIGNYAFNGCTNLSVINFSGTTSQWNAISKSPYWATGRNRTTSVVCSNGTVVISAS